MLTATANDHDITPVKGSARQLDGSPSDLLRPLDYPAVARCSTCGRAIGCRRWFRSDWTHLDQAGEDADDIERLARLAQGIEALTGADHDHAAALAGEIIRQAGRR